jgi:hypothetical protein
MTDTERKSFEGWCLLELMGHRRLGGFISEVTVAGAGMLKIDIPGDGPGEVYATQYYPPSSVYCLTPCSEEAARIVAAKNRPAPVASWEIPRLPSRVTEEEASVRQSASDPDTAYDDRDESDDDYREDFDGPEE